jgi:hypothetical protein
MTYTPNAGFVGLDTVCVVLGDTAHPPSDTVSFVINVTPVPNHRPNSTDDLFTTNKHTGSHPNFTGHVSTNDLDPDAGQTLTFSGPIVAPRHGTMVLNANGTFTFTFPAFSLYQNSSVQFTEVPVPFECVNSPVTYTNGGIDPNGDSLVYSQIFPLTTTVVGGLHYSNITFNAGWSVTNPVKTSPPNTFQFSTTTGIMNFHTAANPEVDVLAIHVDEYRHGVKVGSTMRDIQISILANCGQVVLKADTTARTITNGSVFHGAQFVTHGLRSATSSLVNNSAPLLFKCSAL